MANFLKDQKRNCNVRNGLKNETLYNRESIMNFYLFVAFLWGGFFFPNLRNGQPEWGAEAACWPVRNPVRCGVWQLRVEGTHTGQRQPHPRPIRDGKDSVGVPLGEGNLGHHSTRDASLTGQTHVNARAHKVSGQKGITRFGRSEGWEILHLFPVQHPKPDLEGRRYSIETVSFLQVFPLSLTLFSCCFQRK